MIIIYNLSHVREGEGKVEREDISLLTGAFGKFVGVGLGR